VTAPSVVGHGTERKRSEEMLLHLYSSYRERGMGKDQEGHALVLWERGKVA